MKKIFNWMLAAILICGASVFTSCSNDDDPATESDLGVAEKMMGKWISASVDGEALPTNEKMVYDFVSTTEAFISSSFSETDDYESQWVELSQADVVINGNKVTVTHHPEGGQTVYQEFTVTSINDKEFTANMKLKISVNGKTVDESDNVVRFTKVKVDYSVDILGMWEGQSTGSEGSEFDDGENHRWEYLADGTFNYYHKVDGEWQLSNDDYADYFVAGNLLCTRWKNAGAGNEEHGEWWEIESIEDGVMKWKALREKKDGTTYTATFEMKKVKKCARVDVKYSLTTAKENKNFFVGKYATWSGDTKEDPETILGTETNGDYSNVISTFPHNEDFFIHYDAKELESYEGNFILNWTLNYTVTTYDADDNVLDTKTFDREKDFNGTVTSKEDLEIAYKMAYMEVHASIGEYGDITITHTAKNSGDSGIDW